MKATRKTTRRTKTRRESQYGDENIFNPFSPLFAWMKKPGRKKKECSEHPFRDSFITVVLLHVIAVLVVLAYGAIKNSGDRPDTRTTKKQQTNSQVAKMLDGPSAQPLITEPSQPGEKLLPVRQQTLARDENISANRSLLEAGKDSAAEEEALPAIVAAPRPSIASAPKASSMESNEDRVKQAFLSATGRSVASVPVEPKARQAEPPEKEVQALSTAEQPPQPAVAEYVVQPGDNIFTISRRMNVSFTELAAANNLKSPRDVRVGQTLVRPSADRL